MPADTDSVGALPSPLIGHEASVRSSFAPASSAVSAACARLSPARIVTSAGTGTSRSPFGESR